MNLYKHVALQMGITVLTALTANGLAWSSGVEVDALRSGTAHEALFGLDVDAKRWVSVGGSGAWLQSDDRGKTWVKQETGTDLALLDVSLGTQRDVAVGQMGTVVMCRQIKCSVSNIGTVERLMAVAQHASGDMVVVGGFGTAFRSVDGGQSWQSISPDWQSFTEQGLQPHLYDVAILDNGAIVMVGEFGLIIRSSDQGVTWETLHSGAESIFSIEISDSETAYAVGQGNTVLRSMDSGQSWARISAVGTSNWLSVRSSGAGQIYVAGMREMISSSDAGEHWESVNDPTVGMLWFASLQVTPTAGQVLGVGQAGTVIQMRSK